MKTCRKCGGSGPFSGSQSTKDGLRRDCDSCTFGSTKGAKVCPRCGGDGPYGKDRGRADGLRCYCVSCCREEARVYREGNRDKIRGINSRWKENNPEKSAEYARNNYALNLVEAREERRKYYDSNKDRMNERSRLNYYGDRESRLIQIAAWRLSNPEKVSRISETRRMRMMEADGEVSAEQIGARIDFFGGRCAYCFSRPWEHLDHAIPVSKGGTNWPANLRPACSECNLSKNAQAWFLVSFGPVYRKRQVHPGKWMKEREREFYEQHVCDRSGILLRRLAERFGHDELIEHANVCDDLGEDELEDLCRRVPSFGSREYSSWLHAGYTSGALA